MGTNYSQAWSLFTETKEYEAIVTEMRKKGFTDLYIDNILHEVFAAGWNATGTKIEIIH